MEIIRRMKNGNYTTISNAFLRDKNLSLKAKGLMCVIMGLPEGWDFSVKGLVSITKEGKNAIYSSIKELMDAGYCKCIPIRGEGGKFGGNEYTFTESPHPVSPYPENPDTVNPDTENPYPENPPQLNKELIKDLNNKNNHQHHHNAREEEFSRMGGGEIFFSQSFSRPSLDGSKPEEKEKGCAEKEKEAPLTPYTPVRKLSIEECVKECLSSRYWMESVCMTHGLEIPEIERLLKNFPNHLVVTGNDGYKTLKDFKSHFNNYLFKLKSNGRNNQGKTAGRGIPGASNGKGEGPQICRSIPANPNRGKPVNKVL